MQNKDIQIILQNCNTAAAAMTASLPCNTVDEAAACYASLYEMVTATVLGKITEETVQDQMPGAQVVNPAQEPGYPQPSGPSNGGAPMAQFPQAQPYPGEQPFGGPPQGPGPVPQPAPFNPATATYQGPQGGVQTSNPADADWHDLFNNWGQWWDNRGDKKTDKHPDFKHRTRKGQNGYNVGLYLNRAPEWAKQRLGGF